MSPNYDVISRFLRTHFCYENYEDAISYLRYERENYPMANTKWEKLAISVRGRLFAPGQPLELIHNFANQPLKENTDEEAYKWLDLMIQNVEREDGEIICY